MFEEINAVRQSADAVGGELRHWDSLFAEAKAGKLYLSEDAAVECFAACDNLRTDLENMLKESKRLEHVAGFGGFDCADDLMQMFRGLATESQDVIRNHIKVVTQIRDTIAYSVRRIADQDAAAAQALARVYPDGRLA